jgi:hypothetical protein
VKIAQATNSYFFQYWTLQSTLVSSFAIKHTQKKPRSLSVQQVNKISFLCAQQLGQAFVNAIHTHKD